MGNFIETEMLPISKYLATSKILRVPEFQRSYAWSEDEVSQLWDDVVEAIDNAKAEYFIGPIVVKDDNRFLEVIDGQQRLTTALILISIIRRIFRFNGDNERADWFRNEFYGKQDVITLKTSEKFFMNEENNQTFRDYVIADATKDRIKTAQKSYLKKNSNYLLLQSILTLWELVDEHIGDKTEKLLELHNYLYEKVKILVLTVQDEADAYVIFETLNDRGKSLDTMDLLKNHLFSKSKSYLSEVKEEWGVVKEKLHEIDPKNRFLSHFWSSKYGRSSKTGLFRVIRDQIDSANAAVSFANELANSARVYSALQNPDSPFWDEHEAKTKKYILSLRVLDSQQSLPVLIAASEKFPPAEFAKLAWLMVVMAVRYNLICEGRTGVSSNYYSEIPKKIRAGDYTKASHAFNHLKTIYPGDDEFYNSFISKSLSDTKRARYLLIEIENHASGQEKVVNSDPEKVNLEHIMPKNVNQHWNEEYTGIPSESRSYYVNSLGNMALVSKEKNRRVGSKSFDEKKKELFSQHAEFEFTHTIASLDEWTKESIEERQRQLAAKALEVWKIEMA
ncbi:DUF262 domain-containing protein [Acaryochloris sp. 'Moss Beach']|uniref:DUF262 domain-containing protein n=1 Tax=Acaryochloris sp. 'Moss Beach' TaxID=2740837 RepID=UPI001F2E5C41|nr:DUF262 domain-containing protein [Acaryochloris sp. 'Moss Beach']UJB68853.1 DUF262 domain-containing protein [Acaryochloris sp. 'Moss Beach']